MRERMLPQWIRSENFLIAGWGGIFGVMFAFFITAFIPRPLEYSMKIQLNEPPAWLLTPGLSEEQLIEGMRSEAVLSKLEEPLRKEMISVEAIPDTYLFKITVRQSGGGREDEAVTSLVTAFDDIFTEMIKKQAMLNLTKKFDGQKAVRAQLEKVESEILRIMPEYFKRPSTDCASGSEAENQRFSDQLRAYDEKRKRLEETDPRFVALVKERGELAVAASAMDPKWWTIRSISIPYTCVRVIEEASPPVRSRLPNLAMFLAGGGGMGFLMFLLAGNTLLSLLGGGKSGRGGGDGSVL